jgi:hypothetical protein
MYTILAAIFSVGTNLSMTVTLDDKFDNYAECLYWAATYKQAINDQQGPVQVRSVECRKS